MIPNDLVDRIDKLGQREITSFTFTKHPLLRYEQAFTQSTLHVQPQTNQAANTYLETTPGTPNPTIALHPIRNPRIAEELRQVDDVLQLEEKNNHLYDQTIEDLLTIQFYVHEKGNIPLRPEPDEIWEVLHEISERNVAYKVLEQATKNYHELSEHKIPQYASIQRDCYLGVQTTNKQLDQLQKILVREEILRQMYQLDQPGLIAAKYTKKTNTKQLPPPST